MDTLLADLRQAVRAARNSPAFTVTAIAALALGIGSNTAIFSVVNAVILKPLPYATPDRLVSVQRSFKDGPAASVSIPKYTFWRDHNRVFDVITAYDFGGPGFNLAHGGKPELVQGVHVSQDFFRVFGGSPLLGRTFSPSEDRPNGPPVVVLSHALWKDRLHADPQIAGKALDLSGKPYTVIGVMSAGFQNPTLADLWLPLQADAESSNQAHFLGVTARLKPGMSVPAANAQLKIVAAQYRRAKPGMTNADESIVAIPLQESVVGNVRPALLILGAAVCFVLLIACANMANLLLARAATRQRELAVRAAIGASRGRLVRQMLTESVFLSVVGAAFGLLLGIWGVRVLLQVSPGQIPRVEELIKTSPFAFLDWRVALYTTATAFVTGILFGLFPALRFSTPDLNHTLKESSSRAGTGLRQNRARSVLVVSEVALAIVLLTGAGLLIRTFAGLRSESTGIDAKNVLTFETSLADGRYQTSEAVDRFETRAIEQLERIPGVTAAASVWMTPLHSNLDLPVNILGRPGKGEDPDGDEFWRPVKPHVFAVYRLPLLRGRLLKDTDTAASRPVVVVNEEFAKKYWPQADPIGKQVLIGKAVGPMFADSPRTVVGVVAGQREAGLNAPFFPVMYIPSSQTSDAVVQFGSALIPRYWVIRTASNPARFVSAVTAAMQQVDGRVAVAKARPLQEITGDFTARENFNMLLLSIFAGIALLLAALGLYGLISYSVQQRTQEIGIRMALGAGRFETMQLIGRQMIVLVGAGLVLGLAGSLSVTRYMASLLFEVKPTDPVVFAAVAGLLVLVSIFATWIPVRRAMRVDPVIALRYE